MHRGCCLSIKSNPRVMMLDDFANFCPLVNLAGAAPRIHIKTNTVARFRQRVEDRAHNAHNMATVRKLRTRPSGHEAGLCDVAFTPDGQHVLTSGGDGQVMIWSASKLAALGDGEPEHEGVITDDDDGITTMAVTPDGKYVITGSYGGRRVKRWTLETKELDKCLTTCDGHVHHVATNATGALVYVALGCMGVCGLWL